MRQQNRAKERDTWIRRTRHNLSRKGKSYNPHKGEIKVHRVLGNNVISAPVNLDLYNEENRELFLEFIELLESMALERRVNVDFQYTESVSAAGLLLMYATIDELKNNPEAKLVRFSNLKGNVKNTVEKSGLKGITLNKEMPDIDIHTSPLPIVRGTSKGEEFEVVIDHVQHHLFDNDMTPEEENILATAVIETVSNVKLHAYTNEDDKPWWIICNVIGDELYLAICDKGVGIPNTIKEQGWIKSLVDKSPTLLQRFVNGSDADAIAISMEVGQTSTKKEKHGLGSKSIKALVDENPDGALWVFSNKGVYYKTDNETESKNFKRSISGTLVQWNIKLNNG
ncbi:ATP-binding protein [Vibrio harveyi]|uniref:ATP-binding protein n=1 Tax=Vibrio harveyi TaxID=669 RepID=UPI00042A040E|nr:ATP-binding protein [Vibrio harveyi]EMB9232131.1 ATP-binding protein [Vibrio harveyi]